MSSDNGEDQWVRKLQREIKANEEKIFSKKVIGEYRNPKNFGFIDHPDASGKIKGPCGDTMRIDLRVKKNVIQEARFWTDGCGASLACGNKLTAMIKEKSIEEVIQISSDQLLEVLDGLSLEHQHCATLAVNTLHRSLESFHKRRLK